MTSEIVNPFHPEFVKLQDVRVSRDTEASRPSEVRDAGWVIKKPCNYYRNSLSTWMIRKDARALTTDHEIMCAVREGDLDRMSMLFDRHGGHLLNFFLRMTGRRQDSEDLVQEVFLRMLRYRHNYRDDSRFETWMFQIARSARIDAYRKAGRCGPLPEDRILTDPSPGPEELLLRKTESELIHRALALLPEDKREVLLLSRFENLGFREIARILGTRETTVKVRAHRAVRELGKIVQRLDGEK